MNYWAYFFRPWWEEEVENETGTGKVGIERQQGGGLFHYLTYF